MYPIGQLLIQFTVGLGDRKFEFQLPPLNDLTIWQRRRLDWILLLLATIWLQSPNEKGLHRCKP
ncbi:MAG: hypothetical protein A2061_03465 [Gallionellales bacterium GWA2_59_43]|nr:MAG: hypothetical protein A2061_03465 [Gallionellales bacterium GWA2_59_43]